jgi:hypothetical protein
MGLMWTWGAGEPDDQDVDLLSPASRPGRQLAIAVLQLAVDDLRDPAMPAHVRDGAAAFFRSDWLSFWCGPVDLDARVVREQVLGPPGR